MKKVMESNGILKSSNEYEPCFCIDRDIDVTSSDLDDVQSVHPKNVVLVKILRRIEKLYSFWAVSNWSFYLTQRNGQTSLAVIFVLTMTPWASTIVENPQRAPENSVKQRLWLTSSYMIFCHNTMVIVLSEYTYICASLCLYFHFTKLLV